MSGVMGVECSGFWGAMENESLDGIGFKGVFWGGPGMVFMLRPALLFPSKIFILHKYDYSV